MSDSLIKFDSQLPSDEIFNAVATATEFLPRIQLMGSNSDPVKENLIHMGRYAFIRQKGDVEDLGDQVDVIVISWRPKAMRLVNGTPENVYDIHHPEYKKIQEESKLKDSGCMAGPEFLIWLPSKKSFCTLFMSSISAKREAPKLRALIKKAATLSVTLASNKKYKWHAPIVSSCSTPITSLPDKNKLQAEVQRFSNPQSDIAETTDKPNDRAR